MKKSLCFISLVLASQGFVSFLPAMFRAQHSDVGEENGCVTAANFSPKGRGVVVLLNSDGTPKELRGSATDAGVTLGIAKFVSSGLEKTPGVLSELIGSSVQRWQTGAWSPNSAQQRVDYESRAALTYPNGEISAQNRSQETPWAPPLPSAAPGFASSGVPPALDPRPWAPNLLPAVSGMPPAAPWAPTSNLPPAAPRFALSGMPPALPTKRCAPASSLPVVPSAVTPTKHFTGYNSQPTRNEVSAGFAALSNNHASSFAPQNGYGVCEGFSGLSAPLPPEVLSPSQFAYSQTSTLGTEGQNITDSSATNGQLSAVPLLPPPPPPPPPPMPGPNDVPPLRSQSGPKQADASSASGGDNPLPNSQKKNKTTLMFVEELDQKLKAKDKKLAGSAQKAADQKSDNAQDATDATLKKLQQHVGASKEDKDLKKLHDDLKEVTDVAAYLNLQTLKTDAEALEDEDNLTLLKKAAKVVDSLDGFKLSEKARLILKKAAETGALPTNFHKIVEEAFNEEEKAKEMSNLIGLALQYLEPQKVVSPAPDGAHNDKQKTLGGLLLKRLNTNSSRPSLQEALGRMKQRWATASDADDFYDNDAKAQQLKDLLPKALVLSEVMETVKKTQAELAAKLAAQTTAQSAAPQREESAKGEPVKKPPQAPEQSSGNQEPTTLKEQLAAVLKPGQKPLRPSKPAAETSSSALSQMPSLDPEPSEEPSAYEEDLYERLKREKAAQAEAEKANAENQQPQTAAEVFGGTKLKKRTPHAGGVKVL